MCVLRRSFNRPWDLRPLHSSPFLRRSAGSFVRVLCPCTCACVCMHVRAVFGQCPFRSLGGTHLHGVVGTVDEHIYEMNARFSKNSVHCRSKPARGVGVSSFGPCHDQFVDYFVRYDSNHCAMAILATERARTLYGTRTPSCPVRPTSPLNLLAHDLNTASYLSLFAAVPCHT